VQPDQDLRTGYRALGLEETDLRKSGQVKTTRHGQVIEHLDATQIVVRHRDVVIRGNRVGSRGDTVDAIVIREPGLGTLIEFNELAGSDQAGVVSGNGILGYQGSWTARHNDIHHVTDGAKVGSDVVFEENHVHDVRRVGDTHNDGIQIDKGRRIAIRNNHIELTTAGNAAVWINNMAGPVEDVVVESNFLRAPGFVLKVANKRQGYPRPEGVVWRDNVLYRDRGTRPHPTPRWGPWGGDKWLVTMSGNRWSDTGELIEGQQ